MTEAEWLMCEDPLLLLKAVDDGTDKRKLRLFALACCQRIQFLLSGEDTKGCRAALVAWENEVEGPDGESRFRAALGDVVSDAIGTGASIRNPGEAGLYALHYSAGAFETACRGQWANCADFACDAVAYDALWRSGNPGLERIAALWEPRGWPGDMNQRRDETAVRALPEFVSALRTEQTNQVSLIRDIFGNPFRPVIFSPSWRTSDAIALASQMYESRDFNAMPILADALQDAGCDNADILNHCRDTSLTHVRGCWVVDLVLDKT
ncbi:hypothetical protein VT84_28605 [Gemmata sp. SH-PL17]|uniref:hypothetical protein n=1 Tax=Gemmata sp. SH-PL17 TaxID=1630693 RepID=UPI00078D1AA1|nr:hypothetical protein [Gemmata sp. SH-PL17]AMV28399.1 hypothetical protein VT84_28605 [Gemmata sp. SH-PL17]